MSADEIARLCSEDVRAQVVKAGKEAGFLYIAADLAGYRTGSMNEGDALKEA